MNRNPRVVVVGSSNADMVAQVPRAPVAGETILCESYFVAPGGKGANQAVAAARMECPVLFVACLGDDPLGRAAREGFERDGIDVRYVDLLNDAPTGTAFIWVEENGENRIVVASGANRLLSPRHIDRATTAIQESAVLLCQLETPLETVRRSLGTAREAGVLTILNPAPAAHLDPDLLALVDILTPNQGEAVRLLDLDPQHTLDPAALASFLLERGPRAVILTLGSDGVLLQEGGQPPQHIPAPAVQVVDSTAAGDVLNGVLAASLAKGLPLLESVRLSVAAASLSCTRMGAQPSIPTQAEVSELMGRLSASAP